MMGKDEWVSAAMADDRVVVELLVRLKQSQASSSMKSASPAVIPAGWGLRQRRSRIVSPFRYDISSQKNKEPSSTRCSPTTPLSWSGDTSPSATADGFEESSHPTSFSHSSRSKGSGADEFSNTVMAKRLKRKKALADLKVEECLLLKERVHLKKELASLHATFEEQTTNNETLKKMKLNLNFNKSANSCDERMQATSNQPCQSVDPMPENTPSMSPIQAVPGNNARSDSYKPQEIDPAGDDVFFLPDLNMIPAEDCL